MATLVNYYVGLDLGQAQDYTALAILEQSGRDRPEYRLRHLERLQLRTSYPDVVTYVQGLMASEPLKRNSTLIVDATGVGRPVADLLRLAKLEPIIVTIHGGDSVSAESGGFRVPKRDLVSSLQLLFQSGRLRIAEGLPMAQSLVQELLNFRVRINLKTAHDSYEAWREGQHDDLVLAVALAAWYAEFTRGSRGVVMGGRLHRETLRPWRSW